MNMTREEAAYDLAGEYLKFYKKYTYKIFSLNTIKNTKWWIHFLRAADLRYIDGWSAYKWVSAQFKKEGKILPFRLYGKRAIDNFQDYENLSEKENKDLTKLKGMLSTYKNIYNNIKNYNSFEDFFEENEIKVKRGNYSKHFLSIFKPFIVYNKEHNILNEDELKIKRAILFKNEKIKSTLQKTLKENFY